MNYQIATILFDIRNRNLSRGSVIVRLEPKPFLLLQALVEADGNTLSRDQLIEQIWDGRIISESAINKTVSMLRQHLASLDEDLEFIETIPKLGYRLVVTAETLTIQPNVKQTPHNWVIIAAGMVLLVSILVAVTYYVSNPSHTTSIVKPERVVAQQGLEVSVSTAPQAKQFSYLHVLPDGIAELWLANRHSQQKVWKAHIKTQALSQNAKRLAYVESKPTCQIKVLNLDSAKHHTLFPCQDVENIKLQWADNDSTLVYRKRANIHSGYAIYSYNLNTKQHKQLTLPPTQGNLRGDHLFSLSPDNKQLAVAKYQGENQHQVTLYHYPRIEVIKHLSIPLDISAITWSHDAEKIFFTDDRTLYQLPIDQGTVTAMHEFTAPIESLANLGSTNNALLVNQYRIPTVIQHFNHETKDISTLVENGAQNRLPRANSLEQLWYISDRANQSSLWYGQAHHAEQHQASNLPNGFSFQRYQLNKAGDAILYELDDAIYQTSIKLNQTDLLVGKDRKPYVANYNEEDDAIIYSSEQSGSWQLWEFNLTTQTHQMLTKQGGYSGYSDNDVLYFTKFTQPGIWQLKDGKESELIADVPIVNWLNWKLVDEYLYYFKDNAIWRYHLNTEQTTRYFPAPANFLHQYDVLKNGDIIFAATKDLQGELWKIEIP
ncbi:winged helix-turn-helix domain-containing protein [Pseudoalteromonas sp. T1lg65]|uniref:winged helix-turn-helix domain-containing protein n=1 Tax=Pseudoalteromonas sp. T1lg65 TaxID=2077101 RepID=UPI003F78DB95